MSLSESHKAGFLCLGLCACLLPHFGLDYQYQTLSGLNYRLPNGQYYFFWGTLAFALALVVQKRDDIASGFRCENQILVSIGLIFIGFVLSNTGFGGWRLLAIITLLSLSAILGGFYLQRSEREYQRLFLIALYVPFALVLFGSMLIALSHNLGVGLLLNLMIQQTEMLPRWYFLNASPNGYGFDVAVCGAISYATARDGSQGAFLHRHRWFWWFATLLAMCALILSGTRASYLFFIIFVFAHEVLFFKKRIRLFLIAACCSFILLAMFWLDLFEIQAFLRIQETIGLTSSGRFDAILLMIKNVVSEPFHGVGFGGADDQRFGIVPTNSLYPALALEIGIIGFVGAILFMSLPLTKILQGIFRNPESMWSAQNVSLLERVSICFLISLLGYELFEFDVFRVSVTNQLFMLCWAVSYFKMVQMSKEYEREAEI
jgi:hypothetical protein